MAEAAAVIGIKEPIVLSVDNGATNTRMAQGGGVIEKILAYPTPQTYEEAIGQIALNARTVLHGKTPDVMGFSIAGKVEDGRIIQAGELAKRGWLDRPFAEDIAAEIGIHRDRVVLLNDCIAGANAERVARHPGPGEAGSFGVLSTGFNITPYTGDKSRELIPDEAGHHFLKHGAKCGCGGDGCIEAHISGSGIAEKYKQRAESIPHDDPRWKEVKNNFHEGVAQTLRRYENEFGISLSTIGFTGAVALGGPDMLGGLQRDLYIRLGNNAPHIEEAIYKDRSGLYGAAFAADDALRAM